MTEKNETLEIHQLLCLDPDLPTSLLLRDHILFLSTDNTQDYGLVDEETAEIEGNGHGVYVTFDIGLLLGKC